MNFEIEDIGFLKNVGNGIFLNKNQIEVLDKYQIDYSKCNSLEELIYQIEVCLNGQSSEFDDLDYISSQLSEFNYYNNTNK